MRESVRESMRERREETGVFRLHRAARGGSSLAALLPAPLAPLPLPLPPSGFGPSFVASWRPGMAAAFGAAFGASWLSGRNNLRALCENDRWCRHLRLPRCLASSCLQ